MEGRTFHEIFEELNSKELENLTSNGSLKLYCNTKNYEEYQVVSFKMILGVANEFND